MRPPHPGPPPGAVRCPSPLPQTIGMDWSIFKGSLLSESRPAVTNIAPVLALAAQTPHGIFVADHAVRAQVLVRRSHAGVHSALLTAGRAMRRYTSSGCYLEGYRGPPSNGPPLTEATKLTACATSARRRRLLR